MKPCVECAGHSLLNGVHMCSRHSIKRETYLDGQRVEYEHIQISTPRLAEYVRKHECQGKWFQFAEKQNKA
ncbi:hypothetical protein DO66_818 [Burkholderia pseudomallei]|nr:hypothetical protein DO66_818 [Burkholderia pseudomallei]KGV08145.1 hypothetical protein X895_1091 [Burkholderia pseudomallei MSHR4503]KGV48092.1 hypothetical protein X900_3823 [Burkholderia pseudomallei BDU 2]KGX67972.1 hypothetical protein Y025_226 [Burkholderia pseudomallei TSV32]